MSMYLRGICSEMCPVRERDLRQKEGLLHVLELPPGTCLHTRVKADPKLTVKSFSRSAAGQHAPRPDDVRPPQVLLRTIRHLFTSPVVQRPGADWCLVYDFVFDRLRAVRQDLVVQGLSARDRVDILEPIVRFHCYAGYRLCKEPVSKFDASINRTHLIECLKRLLVSYDELEDLGDTRGEMEALYLLLGLGDNETLTRGLHLSPELREHRAVSAAFQMSVAMLCGNYVRVCAMLPSLPPLLMCAAALQLPSVRRHALCVMSHAFSSRNLTFPLDHLSSVLAYQSEKEAAADCEQCGIAVQNGAVSFSKAAFKLDAMIPCWKVSCVDEQLQSVELSDILL